MSEQPTVTLPDGWASARLDQVSQVRLGRQRSPKNHEGDDMRPYLRAANVTWSGIDVTDVKSMNFTDAEVEAYKLEPGDILLSEASGSAKEVGKPALWTGQVEGPMCFQNTLLRVRAEPGIRSEYLHFRLLHECLSGGFVKTSRGVGIHHLGAAKLAALKVEVPPAPEQGRIAAAIAERLADVEETLKGLQRLERLTEALRRAVLREFDIRHGEATLAVGDFADVSSGTTPAKSDGQFYEAGDIPWVTSGDLNNRRIREPRQFVTRHAVAKTALRMYPTGTLLVAMYGEGKTRGRAARLMFDATTNQACAGIQTRPGSPVTTDFLHAFFDATYDRNRTLSSGGVQPNLSGKVIKAIRVPVRDPAAQADSVERYESYLAQHDRIMEGLRVQRERLQRLERSVLSFGFAGRLVDQDPSDEPASVMLERIREARKLAKASDTQAGRGTVRRTRTTTKQEKTA